MPDELVPAKRWMTAGELRRWLERFDDDMPVTVLAPTGANWLNITGATDPSQTDEPSIILITADDFDTRQF